MGRIKVRFDFRFLHKRPHVAFLVNDPYVNTFESLFLRLSATPGVRADVFAIDRVETPWAPGVPAAEIQSTLNFHGIKSKILKPENASQLASSEFIFLTNPYDDYRNEAFHSEKLKEHSKLMHISYGTSLLEWKGELSYLGQNPFWRNATSVYIESNLLFQDRTNFIPVGIAKLDKYIFGKSKITRPDIPTLVWKPHWSGCIESLESQIQGISELIKRNPFLVVKIFEHPFLIFTLQREKSNIKTLTKYEELKLSDAVKVVSGSDFLDDVLPAHAFLGTPSSTLAEYWALGGRCFILDHNPKTLNALGLEIAARSTPVKSGDFVRRVNINPHSRIYRSAKSENNLGHFVINSKSAAENITDDLYIHLKSNSSGLG